MKKSYLVGNSLVSLKVDQHLHNNCPIDEWTENLKNVGQVDVIYTDFEKAFDKVPYRRLLSKMYSYSINKNIINTWSKCS